MRRKEFCLYQKRGFWYVRFFTPEGGIIGARSTRQKDRDKALMIVGDWLQHGIPPKGTLEHPTAAQNGRQLPETIFCLESILRGIKRGGLSTPDALRIVTALRDEGLVDIAAIPPNKGREALGDFLQRFWNYDNSPYIADRLAHGHNIGRRHATEMLARVKRYWLTAFEGRTLGSITRQDIKDFGLALPAALAAGSKNKILCAGTIAIAWAAHEQMIPCNPAADIERFGGAAERRGILGVKEAAALFNREWKDRRAQAGNLLSATTGLRAGEVLALRARDIEGETLCIRHSWSAADGLKAPKNGRERKVPILPEVKAALLSCLADNPHTDITEGERFIFWGLKPDAPHNDTGFLLDGLKAELKRMGIDAAERAIVFHSWRHFFAALITDKTEAGKVKKVTGHLTAAMLDHYAAHETDEALEAVRNAGRFAFASLVRTA